MILDDIKRRKIYLYGDLRCCRDFEYIFDFFVYQGILCGIQKQELRKVECSEDNLIVICAFDKEKSQKEVEKLGFLYQNDYIIADDVFSMIDFQLNKHIIGKKVYIWGAGSASLGIIEKNGLVNIEGFIDKDKNKSGTFLDGKPIVSEEEIDKEGWEDKFIIINTPRYASEVRTELENRNLKLWQNYILMEELSDKPSDMLKETFYDRNQFKLQCDTMFKVFEVESTGEVSCCCTTFTNKRIGNLLSEDIDNIWNSIRHKLLCLSINNKTYSFCNKNMCPLLLNQKSYIASGVEEWDYKSYNENIKSLHISIDSTCNLYCKTCREGVHIAKRAELDNIKNMKDKILKHFTEELDYLSLAGNGEVFLSKTYEEIWKSKILENTKRIKVLSNGTLITPEKWEEFYQGKENSEIYICISIDAATEETYKKLRRGGDFQKLYKNMKYLSKLRKNREIEYFQINFVVQRENYLEMEKFVEFGIELGVDKVFFTKVLNWGTYTEEEFQEITMMSETDEPNKELCEILEKPIFQDPIVDLGTIRWEKRPKTPNYVQNFYDWEIQEWRKRLEDAY